MFKIIISLSFLFPLIFQAQVGTGNWRMHVANKGLDIAAGGNQVFVALETGLLEYDIEAKESSLWTDVNALSDIQVSCVFYHTESNSFFIGYANGNIDRIQNSSVTNIPAIKLASIQGSKRINSFNSLGNFVYAATDIGIVVINSGNNEIKDSYYPNSSTEGIVNVTFANDSIYALTSTRLWKSNLSNVTLADPAQWKIENKLPIAASNISYQNLFEKNGDLFITQKVEGFGADTVCKIGSNGLIAMFDLGFSMEIESVKLSDNKILVTVYDGILVFDGNFTFEQTFNNFSTFPNKLPSSAVNLNGSTFVADQTYGLFEFSGEGLKKIDSSGPFNNSFYSLSGTKNKIVVSAGLIEKTTFNYNVSGAYTFENENWISYNRTTDNDWYNYNIFDISSASINPLNEKEVALGSYSEQPLIIVNENDLSSQFFNQTNAPFIQHGLPSHNNICVSDLEYDKKGNLWVLNCFSGTPLKVFTKDKLWYEFTNGSSSQNAYSGRMIIDYSGNKWYAVNNEGLFGYNDNGTISDPSDDKIINLRNTPTEGDLPDANVTAIAVDYDNEIWIGTTQGFVVLYNPDNAFGASAGGYNAQRIKIDFEGNVEYVLGKTSITDIEVDGGNRKWIATANAGIFLLSPDGTEVLASYTKENSSLISNNIFDMQFLGKTGELFVVTDIGLVSLRTDASTGDDNYEEVIVFPNPVKSSFDGLITIQGIKYDSDVKFTDIAGNLVYQTTSNGGTATWNGKHFNGEKVKAGTYLIWTSSNTEKGRKVGKVVILN